MEAKGQGVTRTVYSARHLRSETHLAAFEKERFVFFFQIRSGIRGGYFRDDDLLAEFVVFTPQVNVRLLVQNGCECL